MNTQTLFTAVSIHDVPMFIVKIPTLTVLPATLTTKEYTRLILNQNLYSTMVTNGRKLFPTDKVVILINDTIYRMNEDEDIFYQYGFLSKHSKTIIPFPC